MILRVAALLALVGLSAVLWVLNCSGPRPEVTDVVLIEPVAPGQPYLVETALLNRSPGKGQVEVTIQLREEGGAIYQEVRQAQMEGPGELRLVVPVRAPLGHYHALADVEYPIR